MDEFSTLPASSFFKKMEKLVNVIKQVNLATVLLTLILSACTTSKEITSRATATASSNSEQRQENNLGLSPLSPFSMYIKETSLNNNHYVNVLNIGDDALLARIHLIRHARQSILIQTFIWEQDESGRLLMYELVEAAKRGVEVKLLVDFTPVPKDPATFAFLITVNTNLEVKVYNPLADMVEGSALTFLGNVATNFRGVNQRMHNKIFIVDDQVAITGGRNHGNEYFDRGVGRNFRDSEVLLIGSVVNDMSTSFWNYWRHPLVVNTREMTDVRALVDSGNYPVYDSKESYNTGNTFDEIDSCSVNDRCISDRFISHHYMAGRIEFFADLPGKEEEVGELKVSTATAAIASFIQSARKSITMQTPYLVVGRRGNKFFKELVENNPDIEILVSSNSLAAADHVHAYAYSYKNKKKYLKKFNWQIYEFKSAPGDANTIISPVALKRRTDDYYVCVHAKTYVVDGEKVWVGSYNLDPRSANLNTEVGVIIYDKQVALAIESDIKRDMSNTNSWAIAKRQQRPIRSIFSGILGTIIQSIPIINIWPFTYSGSYELEEGMQPVSIYDDDFYNRYRYVGPFPETGGTIKEIEARLIKAFFGPLEGLI